VNLTVVVTSNVEDRYRGFLSSLMMEISVGVFTSPRLSAGTRDHIWSVLSNWHAELRNGTIVMTWMDRDAPGGQRVLHLGQPSRTLADVDGISLVRRECPKAL